ncbi:CHAT domain-containing protein [Xylaria bambusicola]|uniref:CHAT domain-containing protein n=1 Tax=Xylaria bambusicola TaxID=326684 RepID=UPI00200847B7|nr:CHAT domain-containing protein [Xylaria bambusicola]KAI0517615.1 CHAT domain-containing protein [Xylaria bambusicola]
MDMRMDVRDLKQKYPDLADKFVSLRDKLDSPADKLSSLSLKEDATSWETEAKQRRETDQRFNELITAIRTKPGFHNFLLVPTREELMAAANLGPIIVVNLSPYRCDAFLIERHRIRVLRLQNLTLEQVQKWVTDLRLPCSVGMVSMLEGIWETICYPCLDALGFRPNTSIDHCPHVWWIPTGLSASCRFMQQDATNEGLLIRILPFAEKEVSALKDLCTSLQLKPVTPAPYKDDVLRSLSECKIFHFAGHGKYNPMDPSQSALLLEDWQANPLTVGDLRDHRLQDNPPFLGYLSACSTGSNMTEDLADESIHLIGALQFAGFRHVVGTLWEVSDAHCFHVARILYETLRDENMTDASVSRGLHRAIKELRDKEIKKGGQGRFCTLGSSEANAQGMAGFYWVPYLHFGG